MKGSKTLLYDYKLYTGWEEFQFAFKAQSSSASIAFLFQQATQYVIDNVELLDENNAAIDVSMNYMWQNKRAENAYSWLSADGVYSEPLPDGRTVWTCSDGWYGYNDSTTNSMETHQLLRNTLIVQDAAKPNGNLVTKIGGTVAAPQAVMIPPDPQGYDDFFWPRDLTVENDSLKNIVTRHTPAECQRPADLRQPGSYWCFFRFPILHCAAYNTCRLLTQFSMVHW